MQCAYGANFDHGLKKADTPGILQQFQDAFADQKRPILIRAKSPSARIDFILVSPNAKLGSANIINTLASDLYPIVSDVLLKRQAPFTNGAGQ